MPFFDPQPYRFNYEITAFVLFQNTQCCPPLSCELLASMGSCKWKWILRVWHATSKTFSMDMSTKIKKKKKKKKTGLGFESKWIEPSCFVAKTFEQLSCPLCTSWQVDLATLLPKWFCGQCLWLFVAGAQALTLLLAPATCRLWKNKVVFWMLAAAWTCAAMQLCGTWNSWS